MQAVEILEKNKWEKELLRFENVSFLQSWNAGEFQKKLGHKLLRLAVNDKNATFALAQVYIVKSKFFSFLYCPRGPLAVNLPSLNLLLKHLKTYALENTLDYILIEPDRALNLKDFRQDSHHTQPMHTLILSLKPDLETLYSSVRKTARYLIKGAKAKNIKITTSTALSDFKDFEKLLIETASRQKFLPHTISYLKKQFSFFAEKNIVKLYLAKNASQTLASAIILNYGKTAVYLHAASNHLGRRLGASQLLVWTAIEDAKNNGLEAFDFWGIAKDDNPNDPWYGITIFKKGFGGDVVPYPGSFIFPVNNLKYNLYRLITFLRTLPSFRALQRSLFARRTKG